LRSSISCFISFFVRVRRSFGDCEAIFISPGFSF
jgi:hypothetical protein